LTTRFKKKGTKTEILISIFLEWFFLLPNHLMYIAQGKKFELKKLIAKDYFSALAFWIIVLLIVFGFCC